MRASTPKKALRAGLLLVPAIILAAAPAVASSPRCDEPPKPACERVQETWFETEWNGQQRAEVQSIKLHWIELQEAEVQSIKLHWDELRQAELQRIELLIPEFELIEPAIPEIKQAEMERWVGLEAHVAPILEASTRHLVSLRQAPEIEKAREASKHLAWKVRERLASMESDSAHPLNPAIQALISVAKVPARGIAPLQQALVGVAKAASHVVLALLA
jgi:hypothetical protein